MRQVVSHYSGSNSARGSDILRQITCTIRKVVNVYHEQGLRLVQRWRCRVGCPGQCTYTSSNRKSSTCPIHVDWALCSATWRWPICLGTINLVRAVTPCQGFCSARFWLNAASTTVDATFFFSWGVLGGRSPPQEIRRSVVRPSVRPSVV